MSIRTWLNELFKPKPLWSTETRLAIENHKRLLNTFSREFKLHQVDEFLSPRESVFAYCRHLSASGVIRHPILALEMAEQFCDVNYLNHISEDFNSDIIHPDGYCSTTELRKQASKL